MKKRTYQSYGAETVEPVLVDGSGVLIPGAQLNRQFSSGGGGSGTVTSFTFTNANGVSGVVTNATTTPNLTLTLGAITPTSIAATEGITSTTGFVALGGNIVTSVGNITAAGTMSASNLSGTNTGDQTLSGLGGISQGKLQAHTQLGHF